MPSPSGPRLSATLVFPNLPPALSIVDTPTTTRFPAMTSAPEPFSAAHAHSLTPLAQLRPQPSTLALTLALRARPWNSAEGSPPFCGRRRASVAFVALVSFPPSLATRDTSRLAPAILICPVRAHRHFPYAAEARRRRPEPSLHPRRCPDAPEFPLEVSNLLVPLFLLLSPWFSRDCLSEPRFAPSGALAPVLCPRLSPPCRPKCARVLPQPPRALLWPCPRLRRDLAAGTSGTVALKTGCPNLAGRWIPDIHPISGGLGLIRSNLISVARCRSGRLDLPLTRAPAVGPGPSVLPQVTDAPIPVISVRRVPVLALVCEI
jgi:hypothetical protein